MEMIMSKQLIAIVTLLIFITGLFGGCTQNSDTKIENNEDIIHIIGTWINVTESSNVSSGVIHLLRVYNFTDKMFNYTFYTEINSKNYTVIYNGTYVLKDGLLMMTDMSVTPYINETFMYVFSSNYTRLTLINNDNAFLVFKRYK